MVYDCRYSLRGPNGSTLERIMKTVYLCGGINALSDADATDWREEMKHVLGDCYLFLDPMRRDYRGREAECVNEIVDGDLVDVINSNIILVNAVRPSWGTAMEVLFAAQLGKCVVTMCPSDKPSPWLVRHSDIIVQSWDDAIDELDALQ